jgi:hypothetical protein
MEAFADLICTEPRENGCSRTPKRVKKFPAKDVVKSFVVSFTYYGLIQPVTVGSWAIASVGKFWESS